jgi:excisionase family DNA binding protein
MISDWTLLETRALLRPDEVARILRCSKRTVYRLVKLQVLDGVSAGRARGLRIPATSLREYIGDVEG